MNYQDFIASKAIVHRSSGVQVKPEDVNSLLFPFQRDLTCWAARKGRAAIFADTGLGKTFMQLEWARPIWYGIKESDTLQVAAARGRDDDRHICPLQLGTIERCVRLWSNPGELVCSPFAGIGSEGYEALRHGRRFIGCELKKEYFDVACRNLREAEVTKGMATLFDLTEVV